MLPGHQFQYMLNLIIHRQRGIDPFDVGATLFHAPEPGHLSLGKLMDGNLQLTYHLVIRQIAKDVERKIFVFKTVVEQVFGRDFLKQSPDLVDHTLLQTFVEPVGNLQAPQIAVDVHAYRKTTELRELALVNVLVKGALLPTMLSYAIRKARTVRELEPLVGFGKSVALIFAATLLSFRFAPETLAVAVSFATIATGLFLIVARRKAITQVIGFLVFENGISIFAAGISMDYGLVIELGILLDVFVLVFILGIAVYEINRTFSSIDIDRLNHLGDTRFMHPHHRPVVKGGRA